MLEKTAAFLEYCDGVQAIVRMKKVGAKTYTHGDKVEEVSREAIYLHMEAKEEVKRLRALPQRVLLAGSSRFKQAFENEAERLALEGLIVLGKHVYKPGAEWPLDEAHRDLIHAVQFRTCDLANRVHIVNVDGYIGQDTYNLIRYAIRTDKPITFLERYVVLMASGAKVTSDRFMQGTRQNVEFEQAAIG